MSISQKVLDYAVYPVVALTPGRVQPWLFSRLPHATDWARTQDYRLTEGESLDKAVAVEAAARYTRISGMYEGLLSIAAPFVYIAVAAESDPNTFDPDMFGRVAAGTTISLLMDAHARVWDAWHHKKATGAIEGLLSYTHCLRHMLSTRHPA